MAAEETKPAQLLVDTQMNGSRGNKATSHQNTSKLKIQAVINKNTEGLCTFSCEDVTDKKKEGQHTNAQVCCIYSSQVLIIII